MGLEGSGCVENNGSWYDGVVLAGVHASRKWVPEQVGRIPGDSSVKPGQGIVLTDPKCVGEQKDAGASVQELIRKVTS